MPFRVVDDKIGLDVDITVRCNGEYSYKIVDPLMFYKNVCGNVDTVYTRDLIDSQLKSELLTALQPAFARISEMGIRYSAVPAHTKELAAALNEELSYEWRDRRGIEVAAFGVNTISAPEDQEQMIRDLQRAAVMANPTMAAANIAAAQSDAMRTAAANPAGAAMGFMGMGMASGMGGMNTAQLFAPGPAAGGPDAGSAGHDASGPRSPASGRRARLSPPVALLPVLGPARAVLSTRVTSARRAALPSPPQLPPRLLPSGTARPAARRTPATSA